VTGLATVDEQHHHLVDVINQFGKLMVQPEGSSSTETEAVFNELARYSDQHFHDEEEMMNEFDIDSDHTFNHRNEHAQFLLDVTAMHSAMTTGNQEEAKALLNFLTNWLAYHILGSDQLMACLIQASKDGTSQGDAFLAYQSGKDPATSTLLQAMERLFNQVSERNRALFELNQTLEARVVERTDELTRANHLLEKMALTDALTGLPNRRQALLVLEAEWQNSMSSGNPIACIMIDADGFKVINDNFGHDAGDEVLRQLSNKLKETVRTDDTICRLGGDEFLGICVNTPLDGAMLLAEKLRHEVSTLAVAAGTGSWKGSISVGVAVRNESMKCVEDLLKAADEGVYVAKRNGRNCVATICR
jgi:hemerythrin